MYIDHTKVETKFHTNHGKEKLVGLTDFFDKRDQETILKIEIAHSRIETYLTEIQELITSTRTEIDKLKEWEERKRTIRVMG